MSSPESKRMPSTALAPIVSACCSRRFIASLRESSASCVSAEISPPKICWQPAQAVPTMLRERTVMPQQGPRTSDTWLPGGASNVVRIGILCGEAGMARLVSLSGQLDQLLFDLLLVTGLVAGVDVPHQVLLVDH